MHPILHRGSHSTDESNFIFVTQHSVRQSQRTRLSVYWVMVEKDVIYKKMQVIKVVQYCWDEEGWKHELTIPMINMSISCFGLNKWWYHQSMNDWLLYPIRPRQNKMKKTVPKDESLSRWGEAATKATKAEWDNLMKMGWKWQLSGGVWMVE